MIIDKQIVLQNTVNEPKMSTWCSHPVVSDLTSHSMSFLDLLYRLHLYCLLTQVYQLPSFWTFETLWFG